MPNNSPVLRMLASRFFTAFLTVLFTATLASPMVVAAEDASQKPPPSAGSIDVATGKILTEAIELLNADNFAGAKAAIAKIKMDSLSPYERSKTEQILATIASSQEDYGTARKHLQAAVDSGGLNEIEISDTRYQIAQMFMAEEMWREGAAALEQWFQTAKTPNSAAYYLLAVAYYQQDDMKRAIAPAEKAIALAEKPQESWVQLVLALYLQQEQYAKAVPLLKTLIAASPETKSYWQQLSSVYGQMEDFPKSLSVVQLAYNAGIMNEDADIRRLADLQLFNDAPYRCGIMLEEALQKKQVKADFKLYEKQANCWVAARDFTKAIGPLQRSAEMSANGDQFIRLGEVQIQRSEWAAAAKALQSGLGKGGLKDVGNAHILLGIAHFSQKNYSAAKQAFTRARDFDKHRQMADGYLQLIKVQAS